MQEEKEGWIWRSGDEKCWQASRHVFWSYDDLNLNLTQWARLNLGPSSPPTYPEPA